MNLDHLNDKQRKAAVCINGPFFDLLGAGEVERNLNDDTSYLLGSAAVSALEILAVTFTNKGLPKMAGKKIKLVGRYPACGSLLFMPAGLRILRGTSQRRQDMSATFVVYDTTDQKALDKNIMKEQNIDADLSATYITSVIQ